MLFDLLYKLSKKNMFFFKLGKRFYHNVLIPLKTGHLNYYFKYYLLIRKKEINCLKKHGFDHIRPYDYANWRIGNDSDGAERRFYIANYSGCQCFVKIGKNDKTVRNEVFIHKNLVENDGRFTPQCCLADISFNRNTTMLAVMYKDGLHSIPEDCDKTFVVRICRQFVHMFNWLQDNQLVHADIHKGNLMLDGDNKIVLLDFGISKFLDKENEINYVERPGTYYRKDGEYRIYGDAYSFVSMLKGFSFSFDLNDNEEYKWIVDKIDFNTFKTFTGGQ